MHSPTLALDSRTVLRTLPTVLRTPDSGSPVGLDGDSEDHNFLGNVQAQIVVIRKFSNLKIESPGQLYHYHIPALSTLVSEYCVTNVLDS